MAFRARKIILYRARQALAGFVVDLGSNAHDPHKRWALASAPSPPHEDPPSQEPHPQEPA